MKKLILLMTLLFSLSAFSEFKLQNITSADMDNFSREVSANFLHTSVSPAKDLGSIWGFEVGLIAGLTKSADINSIIQRVDSTLDVKSIPHAALVGMISIPYSLTLEATMLPSLELGDADLKTFTGALKWTFSDEISLLDWLPIDLALRAHFGTSELSFQQTISSVNTTVTHDTSTYGLNLTAGADLLFLEPYLGVGWVKTSADLSYQGSTSIFDNTFTSGDQANTKLSSTHLFGGLQFSFFLIHLSAEYAYVFDTHKYTGKLSFYF